LAKVNLSGIQPKSDTNDLPDTIPSLPTEVSQIHRDHQMNLSALGFSPVSRDNRDTSTDDGNLRPLQEATFRKYDSTFSLS